MTKRKTRHGIFVQEVCNDSQRQERKKLEEYNKTLIPTGLEVPKRKHQWALGVSGKSAQRGKNLDELNSGAEVWGLSVPPCTHVRMPGTSCAQEATALLSDHSETWHELATDQLYVGM